MTGAQNLALAAVTALGLLAACVKCHGQEYEFVARWPDGTVLTVPAKSSATCREATRGLWQPVGLPPLPKATIECRPANGVFDARSNCIPGYRGPREEGYCR